LILDTNALFAVAEGEQGIEPLLRKAHQLSIPVIVLGEYRMDFSFARTTTI